MKIDMGAKMKNPTKVIWGTLFIEIETDNFVEENIVWRKWWKKMKGEKRTLVIRLLSISLRISSSNS